MSKIEWDDSFSVGVVEIDEQHRRWIEIINKLHDSIMDKTVSVKNSDRILCEMIDYANFHFIFEEDHMKKVGYQDLKKHRQQHEFFNKNLAAKLQEERAGGLVMNTELMKILMNWLREHILEEDMKYRL